jgi:hypothetical protein
MGSEANSAQRPLPPAKGILLSLVSTGVVVFARKIRVEIASPEGARACPLAWLDSFCMRSFTGREANAEF